MPHLLRLYHPDTPSVLRHRHAAPQGVSLSDALHDLRHMLGLDRHNFVSLELDADGNGGRVVYRRQSKPAASDVTYLAKWRD
ncbi:MAG: hypothetical protein HOD00_03755 [Gemmatimonadales bacterium]|nr:hypothetical protein [Gemmatimonadales bacterium]MBT4436630.1 hypothetical protein [Gemmatimonadales bacterium]